MVSVATRAPRSVGHGVPAASVVASSAASRAVGLEDCGRQTSTDDVMSTRAGTVMALDGDGLSLAHVHPIICISISSNLCNLKHRLKAEWS